MNRLHQEFILRFAGHVRMTRDINRLDALIVEMEVLRHQASREAFQSEGRWKTLLDLLDRRLQEYTAERGAVAQIQASAGVQDRLASQWTARARVVLHRFARHFSGQPRRSRDVERLADILLDINEIVEVLRPLTGSIHLRSVAEEISAVVGYAEFLAAERDELLEARHAGTLLDQSDNWQVLLANLEQGWSVEVQSQPQVTWRIGLVERYIRSLDGVLEGLLTARHANLPDQHELALGRAALLLVRWQDGLAAAQQLQNHRTAQEKEAALWAGANALVEQFLHHWIGGHAQAMEQAALRDLIDRLDEVERQLLALCDPATLTHQAAKLAWLRDALVVAEKHFDQAPA